MDSASKTGRRVAYGAQDFVKRPPPEGSNDAVFSARILLRPRSGKPVNMQAISSQRSSMADGAQKANLQVISAIGQHPPPIKSRTIAWQADRPAQSIFPSASTEVSRETSLTSVMLRMKFRFGDSPPNFKTCWENRQKNTDDYQLLSTFGRAASQTESIEFLKAMDNFRSSPSVDKARAIMQTFIEPDPVDDMGIPIDDPSKMQINLQSEEAMKKLLIDLGTCIKKAESGDAEAMNQALTKLLPAENYIADMVKTNLDTVYRAEMKNQARRAAANLVSYSGPDRFA